MDSAYLIVGLIILSRLLLPLAIPHYPLPAIIASLILDGVDQTILQQSTDLELLGYQGYDKALDIYYLTIAYLSTMRNWSSTYAFRTSQFLYYFRLVGVLLFEITQARWLLMAFPNTFEYFFIFYEAVRTRWNPLRMSAGFVIGAAAFIWIVIKLPQEYWIHVAQLDTTDVIREDIFGVPVTTSWGDIVSDNVGVFVALGIGLVALAFGIRWFMANRLPAGDWGWTFAADAPGRDLAPVQAAAATAYRPNRVFTLELFEKVVMLSLVSAIFSQLLPGVSASRLQIGIGVAVWVVLNTALSELLARRGVDFGSALRQFGIMVGVNLGIVIAVELLVLDEDLDFGSTLFFTLLLALMITFYDRYRPLYLERTWIDREPGMVATDRRQPLVDPVR